MKKTIFALLSFLFLLVSCETTGSIEGGNNNFKTSYDDISDVTTVTHKSLGDWSPAGLQFPNIHDGFPRLHLKMYIENNNKLITHLYMVNAGWVFTDKIVLVTDAGQRLEVKKGKRIDETLGGNVIEEHIINVLSDEQIAKLEELVKAEKLYIACVGSEKRTDKYEIKTKTKAAILESINKYYELNNK